MKNKTFKPTRLELELLAPLWALGTASIREIQESLPEKDRPEYTTVQTIIYRLEEKGAVERIKKIAENLKATVIIQHDSRDVGKVAAYPAVTK